MLLSREITRPCCDSVHLEPGDVANQKYFVICSGNIILFTELNHFFLLRYGLIFESYDNLQTSWDEMVVCLSNRWPFGRLMKIKVKNLRNSQFRRSHSSHRFDIRNVHHTANLWIFAGTRWNLGKTSHSKCKWQVIWLLLENEIAFSMQ